MYNKLRNLPPVCLVYSLFNIVTGRLGYSKQFVGSVLTNKDNEQFTIFRHIRKKSLNKSGSGVVFIVSFKFSSLSHKVNRIISKLPMLLIAGFPGFQKKMYAVNVKNGYWQGMYQWRSQSDLEAYQKSLVFRMMNKRAVKGSVTTDTFVNINLDNFIQEQKNHDTDNN